MIEGIEEKIEERIKLKHQKREHARKEYEILNNEFIRITDN